MDSDLGKIPELFELARKSMRVVGQNLFVAALFNTLGIILAVTALINPSFRGGRDALLHLRGRQEFTAPESHHPVLALIRIAQSCKSVGTYAQSRDVILSRTSFALRRISTEHPMSKHVLRQGLLPSTRQTITIHRQVVPNSPSIRARRAPAAVPLHTPSPPPK
jgi:hypothetical protein